MHFRAYRQQAPGRPLAEEALFGIANAYRRLGFEDEEREALQLFVRQYPQSAMLEKAQSRLKQP